MAQRQNPFRGIKVVVRPSPRKLKIVLILLILASLVTLVSLRMVLRGIESQTQAALDQAAELEHENTELESKTDHIDSSSVIRDIAQEELGLVDPDTIIIDPNS